MQPFLDLQKVDLLQHSRVSRGFKFGLEAHERTAF
jgi:hypothetical protein